MNRIILAIVISILGLTLHAHTQDDVLLVIAGKMVTVADFQSAYYRQNTQADGSKADVQLFLKRYVDHYLQVLEAEAQGLDTQPQYQALFAGSNAMSLSSNAQASSGDAQVTIADLFLPLAQHCTVAQQRTLQNRMDSVYQAVQSGSDFLQLMQQVAPSTSSVRRVGQNQVLADIENAAFSLSEDAVSPVILTIDGFHLLKRLSNQPVAQATQFNSAVSAQDYRKGLLMHCLYEKEMKGKAESDVVGMVNYFESNLKNYAWDIPHYKGVLYQCKDKKTLKKVKKLFAKQSMSDWNKLMSNPVYQSLFEQVQIEPVKLYKLSENELVDELVFGAPKSSVNTTYPYKGVSGKVLKKHPDSYLDVRDELVLDYQNHLEQEWIASLHKKYEVAINDKALKQLIKNM